ncbi:MAG TPA: HNH endonuclease signature motif containing protein [Tepidisphaeraceae bacterium]|jgi:hypothetical protein|nr:HNH endonuclease signature motif containing protein [Tepidisphaeraceae bacterium]
MSSYIPASLRRLVIERAHSFCEYCLIQEQDTFLGCQIEHIISQKYGGLTAEGNLALSCVFCNRFKGRDIAALSEKTATLCRLFNPRIDRWSDHFELVKTRINGRTEIGEATAKLLNFNHPDRLLEREILIEIGRYPSKAARAII